jgi:hypothetical protein
MKTHVHTSSPLWLATLALTVACGANPAEAPPVTAASAPTPPTVEPMATPAAAPPSPLPSPLRSTSGSGSNLKWRAQVTKPRCLPSEINCPPGAAIDGPCSHAGDRCILNCAVTTLTCVDESARP